MKYLNCSAGEKSPKSKNLEHKIRKKIYYICQIFVVRSVQYQMSKEKERTLRQISHEII